MSPIPAVGFATSFLARARTESDAVLPLFGDLTIRRPTVEDQWRAIILFGRNVASYKFALAKAMLQIKPQPGSLLRLDDLALPFALQVCEHLRLEDKQATSTSSAFLEGCRGFNEGKLDKDELSSLTLAKGFANVIDAFHVVGQANTPQRFFSDERKSHKALRITDEFGHLLEGKAAAGLPREVESRWRLVEAAWRLRVARYMVVTHDPSNELLLLPDGAYRRKAVTSSRDALNGYQRGQCFYCKSAISLTDEAYLPDVDHFFPHALKQAGFGLVVDGVWNLVLACQGCNRGAGGKFDKLPSVRLLEQLHARNEFLIVSHHPLRETLIVQTGADEPDRRAFLRGMYERARSVLIHESWEPT
jgi:5-methylcytosine-specific restriction endonuclease McrA